MVAVPPDHRGLRAPEVAVLVMLAAIWGASFLFIKVALRDVSPLAVVGTRLALGAVGITGWLLLRRGPAATRELLRGVRLPDALVLAVTASAVPFMLIAWAETRITSSLAGILNATVPLFTAALAYRVDPRNRIRGWRALGLLIGCAGVALVAGTDVGGSALGVVAMLGAGLCYAISTHFAKHRFDHVEPVGVALVQTVTSAAIMVPLALLLARPERAPTADAIWSLLALGLGGTALAWCLYYWLVAKAGPQHAVAVTYLVPISAVLYGSVLLDEHIGLSTLLGMVVILAGEVVVATPARRRVAAEPLPETVS